MMTKERNSSTENETAVKKVIEIVVSNTFSMMRLTWHSSFQFLGIISDTMDSNSEKVHILLQPETFKKYGGVEVAFFRYICKHKN